MRSLGPLSKMPAMASDGAKEKKEGKENSKRNRESGERGKSEKENFGSKSRETNEKM